MRIKKLTIALIAAALLTLALSGPGAGVAAAKNRVTAEVGPDPTAPVDEETGERAEPYVLFALKGTRPSWLYRIVVEQSPKPRPSLPCNPGLTTSWERSFGAGEVAFPTEPATSGTYFPFAGVQPCRGGYVMEVQERRSLRRRWRAVRAFAFNYPSFKFSYVPLR